MRAGLKAAILVAFVACLAASFAFGEGSYPESGGNGVARSLLDEARLSAGIADWATAASYLDAAAAEDPVDADILYLSALADVKLGMPFAIALGKLDAAAETGRFTYYSSRDVSVLKAELLVRERRWNEALDALGSPGAETIADPEYRLVRAKALKGKGDTSAFTAEIGDDLNRFPNDGAFARLFLKNAGKLPQSAAARALGDTILRRLGGYAGTDGELRVLASPLMNDLGSRRDAVLAYRASGHTSAASTLRSLEYGIIDESAAAAELLSGSYPVILEDIVSLMNLAGSPKGRETVFSSLSAWSGTILIDADSDDVLEGSFTLSRGLITAWALDSRQEGVVDENASFSDGLPKDIRLSRTAGEIDILYSTYPEVAAISFAEKGGRRSYSFGPETLSFAPIAMRPFAGSGSSSIYFPFPTALPDPTEPACASSALSVESSSGDSREVVVLDKGRPVSAISYAGDRVLSKRQYEKGRPAFEKVDADGDGRFETEKSFAQDADGAWTVSWIRTDADGDGVFEYREQAVFPFLKEWDYDGNGSVDARQFQLADGSVRKEFSSRLDGRLDEAVVI